MARCDAPTARWLMAHHPSLLRLEDHTHDTPYITLLKSTATKLLQFEERRSITLYYAIAKSFEILMSKYVRAEA